MLVFPGPLNDQRHPSVATRELTVFPRRSQPFAPFGRGHNFLRTEELLSSLTVPKSTPTFTHEVHKTVSRLASKGEAVPSYKLGWATGICAEVCGALLASKER